MTSEGKNTKTEAESQLKDLLASGSENLLAEILTIGLQQLMELERDHYIGADPYERSEKALVAALAEAYVQGVSTRKMAKVTERLLGKAFSASTISRFSEQLDAELQAWWSRRLSRD